MSTYLVGVQLTELLQVEADSAEEAEQVVREMDLNWLLFPDAVIDEPYLKEEQA